MTRVAGLLPAAGSGSRLGRGPKAFLELEGKTLLAHASEVLAAVCDEVVVAVPEGRLDEAHALLPGASIVAGGSSRQETVRLLLDATPDATHVIVHDAARPFTPVRVVQAVLEAAREHGAASAALPIADTLHDTRTNAPLEREALRAIQTPQAFQRALLVEAHRVAAEVGREGTDDAQLVRALGHAVELVPGSPWSHKITRPEDLTWFEALAAGRAGA